MTPKIEQLFAEIRATLDGIKADNAAASRHAELQAKNVWTADDLAFYLGITSERVSRMAKARVFPSYRQNGKNYFKRSEIEDWQTSHRTASHDELASAAAIRSIRQIANSK